MTTFNPESLIALIAWLGGACFCGLVPLGFAAILFFTARKRGQVGSALDEAVPTATASALPRSGLSRLQGTVGVLAEMIDGPVERALVYLRLKVESYETGGEGESSGWRGLTDKARSVPFRLDDGSGAIRVDPIGLDKQLLGDGFEPDEHQIQMACVQLGVNPDILRGRLRYRMWQFHAGQILTVIGTVTSDPQGLLIKHSPGQPFVVSPLLGTAIVSTVGAQTKKASVWTWVLGIPGLLVLLCGLVGALVSLVRLLNGG